MFLELFGGDHVFAIGVRTLFAHFVIVGVDDQFARDGDRLMFAL